MDDAELLDGLSRNLDTHFDDLVLAYQDRLYSFAFRLSGSPQDAEEVAQDAFVRAYHALQGYDRARIRQLRLRAWLHQIALNVFRNRVRGKHLQFVPFADGWEPEDTSGDGPECRWEVTERSRELAALVAALPVTYSEAVVLRFVQGLGYAEAADVLGQPVGTVKANVHRGVKLLRAAMDREMSEVG